MGRSKSKRSRSNSPLRRLFGRLRFNLGRNSRTTNNHVLDRLTWRNVIEVQYVGYGRYVFDKGLHGQYKEKGFYDGVLRGIRYLKNTFSDSLSIKLYKKLHKHVCRNMVKNTNSRCLIDGKDAGQFRDSTNSMAWVIGRYPITQHMFERLNKQYHQTGLGKVERRLIGCDAEGTSATQFRVIYTLFSKKKVKKLVKRAFSRYEKKLNKIPKNGTSKKQDHKRLKAIVFLFKRLEMIHPFVDGNGRTNILILQRELIKNGFPPVKMDFYLMDISSKRYSFHLLKKAVKSTLKAIKN